MEEKVERNEEEEGHEYASWASYKKKSKVVVMSSFTISFLLFLTCHDELVYNKKFKTIFPSKEPQGV